MRRIRFILIGLVCIALIVSTGFGMWVFSSGVDPQIINGNVSVEGVDLSDKNVEIVSPTHGGLRNYQLSFVYSHEDVYEDVTRGVTFLPSIRIKVKDYDQLEEGQRLWIKFDFDLSNVTSNLFAANASDTQGYVYLDNISECIMVDGVNQLVDEGYSYHDNNWHKIPTHDAGGNLIDQGGGVYTVQKDFMVQFKYRTTDPLAVDHKPKTIEEYKTLLGVVNSGSPAPKIMVTVAVGDEFGPNIPNPWYDIKESAIC